MSAAPKASIERLAATPRRLAHLVAEATDAALDTGLPGERPARLIMAHLRDAEYLVWRVGLERMLAEANPALNFLHGPDWEVSRNTSRDRKVHLLADFALQRQATLGILNAVRPHEWDATGMVLQAKRPRLLSLAAFVWSWAAHDAEHFGHIEQALGETYEQVVERRMRRE